MSSSALKAGFHLLIQILGIVKSQSGRKDEDTLFGVITESTLIVLTFLTVWTLMSVEILYPGTISDSFVGELFRALEIHLGGTSDQSMDLA
jgi:hypothetical protein